MAGLGLLCAAPSKVYADMNVFACEPEWAALTKEIGGDLVNVTSATTAQQDVHHIRAKPSLLSAMRKADLVVCSGAALESGWLPILLKKAGGPDVQPETIGWIMVSDFVQKLEIMQSADRSMGHIHPEGNPHVHLDPGNIKIAAEVIADRLFQLDQENAQIYGQNLDDFLQKWEAATAGWNANAAALKGQKVVVYHNSWAYLVNWLGMDVVATLEPKPGLPPTAAHLDDVLQKVKGQDVRGILVAPFESEDAAQWLSDKTNIPVVHLPFTVGGNAQASSLESLFDDTIARLKGAP
jgi:zinc/manganese transport system substrate-binding protein